MTFSVPIAGLALVIKRPSDFRDISGHRLRSLIARSIAQGELLQVAPEQPRAAPAPCQVTVVVCRGALAAALADPRIQDFDRRGIELFVACEDSGDRAALLARGNEERAALLAAA